MPGMGDLDELNKEQALKDNTFGRSKSLASRIHG